MALCATYNFIYRLEVSRAGVYALWIFKKSFTFWDFRVFENHEGNKIFTTFSTTRMLNRIKLKVTL